MCTVYGVFQIKISITKSYYIVILENLYHDLKESDVILRIYDLKGSNVNREMKGFHNDFLL